MRNSGGGGSKTPCRPQRKPEHTIRQGETCRSARPNGTFRKPEQALLQLGETLICHANGHQAAIKSKQSHKKGCHHTIATPSMAGTCGNTRENRAFASGQTVHCKCAILRKVCVTIFQHQHRAKKLFWPFLSNGLPWVSVMFVCCRLTEFGGPNDESYNKNSRKGTASRGQSEHQT